MALALGISNSYLQRTCLAVAIAGVILAILATVLRFVATRRSARKPGWEDWLAVLATIFYIFYVVPFLYFLSLMNGRELMEMSASELVALTKTGYVMAAQFCPQQTFAKLSLVALYHRIFNTNRTFVRCLYVVGGMQIGWGIGTYVAHWTECTPVAKLWDSTLPGTCEDSTMFLVVGETINSALDFALVGLAIWIVQSLQMKMAAKMKLSIIFALGGLAGILGFVKIGMGYAQMSQNAIALYDPLWATIQQGCSVICCCAPIYKPLIPALGLFSRLKSLSGRAFSRRNGYSSEMQVDKLPLDSLQVDATSWEHEPPVVGQQVVYPDRAATKEHSQYPVYGQHYSTREEV